MYLSNDLKSGNLNTCNKLPCMARTKELNKRLCEVVQDILFVGYICVFNNLEDKFVTQ